MDRDPAGLLERMPELEPLCSEDQSLRQAVARGKAHAVYRRLWWLRLLRRMPEHRAVLDALLARRRLFLEPLRGAPVMATLNGFGARVYGNDDRDPDDGTYITSYFITAVFVPLFPLGAYLVADADSSGRSWHFIGRAPLGPLLYLWQRLLVLGAALGILAGGVSAFYASRHNHIQIVNALPIPVTVTIEGAGSTEVEPFGRATIEAGTGAHAVEVKAGDTVLETGSIDVHAGVDVLAYNVLGAALIYDDQVVYAASAASAGATPEPTVHCDERVVEIDDVDYPFKQPPEKLDTSSKGTVKTVRHVDVAQGGPLVCVMYMLDNQQRERALALVSRVDAAVAFEASVHEFAVGVQLRHGNAEEALRLAELGRAAHDGSLDHHRMYQDVMGDLDARDVLVDEYTERRDRQPDSADAAYLLARIEPEQPGASPFTPLLVRFPKHPYLLRAQIYDRLVDGDYPAAVAAADALRGVDAAVYREAIEPIVEAMVATGAATEAVAAVEQVFPVAAPGEQLFLATLHALAAQHVTTQPRPTWLFAKIAKPASPRELSRFLLARRVAGIELTAAELKEVGNEARSTPLLLIGALADDPERAVELATTASEDVLVQLSTPAWALLYGEAVRTDPDGAAVSRLEHGSRVNARAIAAFVASGDEAALIEIEPSIRAAARVVRARQPEVGAGERHALLAAARKDDILRTIVSVAIERWP